MNQTHPPARDRQAPAQQAGSTEAAIASFKERRSDPAHVGRPALPLTFGEAVHECLTRPFDVRGRASRREFWWFALFCFGASFVFSLAAGIYAAMTHAQLPWVVVNLPLLALVVPTLTVFVRRLHDSGRSAWWLLATWAPAGASAIASQVLPIDSPLLPATSIVLLVSATLTLVLAALPGSAGRNRYG